MRIVELFSGIGSQAKAFQKLNIEHEVLNVCEWNIHALVAYDFIHNGPKLHQDVIHLTKTEILQKLSKFTLSMNGKEPAKASTLKGLHVDSLRAIYSAILKTNNYVSITDVSGDDLPNNLDLLTYSFPCQDLSNVGAFHGYVRGIDRDSNNRSSMLWEVERILESRHELNLDMPKFLLLENVTALLSPRHRGNFEEWKQTLSDMGYYNHVYRLNASDFGLPQNRYRLLMISVYIGNDQETRDWLNVYFQHHNLEDIAYRRLLRIKNIRLRKMLRLDYTKKKYLQEALICQPNDTPSRKEIWGNNLQITNEEGRIIANRVATLTTKQDRHPNSGNLYMRAENGKSEFRYLTPRECFLLMGFAESDYERLVKNNIKSKANGMFFTRDNMIKMAGNSIAVNVLEQIFKQIAEIKQHIFEGEENGAN